MKLLIVDADRDLVEMLTGWLKTLGHEVRRAYSGKQARIAWEDQKPDLVILDTSLHDTDALAMCRDLQRRHDALLMIVTEGKSVQDEIRCLEEGADDYLRKPFFPKQLLAHIRAIIRRWKASCCMCWRSMPIMCARPLRLCRISGVLATTGMLL